MSNDTYVDFWEKKVINGPLLIQPCFAAECESQTLMIYAGEVSQMADRAHLDLNDARNGLDMTDNKVMRNGFHKMSFYFKSLEDCLREVAEEVRREAGRIYDEEVRNTMRDEIEV